MAEEFASYKRRMMSNGATYRKAIHNQSAAIMEYEFKDSDNFTRVVIDGKRYDARVAIKTGDSYKSGMGSSTIQFREGVTVDAGKYIYIPKKNGRLNMETDAPWLLVSNSTAKFFPKHIIKQCDYKLRWINYDGELVERWCVFDDSYKIYDGTRDYDKNAIKLPDFSMVVMLPYDKETVNFARDKRVVVDSIDVVGAPEVYEVTARNVVSKIMENKGVITIALAQEQFNYDTDGLDCMIANCRDLFKECDSQCDECPYALRSVSAEVPEEPEEIPEIMCSGSDVIKLGSSYKKFYLSEIPEPSIISWDFIADEQIEKVLNCYTEDSAFLVKIPYNPSLIGETIRIDCNIRHSGDNYTTSKTVKVVSAV